MKELDYIEECFPPEIRDECMDAYREGKDGMTAEDIREDEEAKAK